jgi:hypothetical protein
MSSPKHDVFCIVLKHLLRAEGVELEDPGYRTLARRALSAADAIWDEVKKGSEATGEGVAAQADKLLDKMRK